MTTTNYDSGDFTTTPHLVTTTERDTCPTCGASWRHPRGRGFEPGATLCDDSFHDEHTCDNCVNDAICKGYRGDLPHLVCRDWEAS